MQIIFASSEVLTEKLTWDECSPNLEDGFRHITNDDIHQGYSSLGNNVSYGQTLEHFNFIPLPQAVLEQYRNVECASFMGLIPEIHRQLS